jgi:catechol 2,3-dioxygenase-like lactoylglutathione lyase family enzyme
VRSLIYKISDRTNSAPENPMQQEFYPMPSFPMLAVADLAASTRWYQEVLGFSYVFEMLGADKQPILTHLRWTKYADLLLIPERDLQSLAKGVGVTLTFAVFKGSVDDLAEQTKVKGANIVVGPITQPWNAREFTVLDPDGYRLVFTQRVDTEMSMSQVAEQVAQSQN